MVESDLSCDRVFITIIEGRISFQVVRQSPVLWSCQHRVRSLLLHYKGIKRLLMMRNNKNDITDSIILENKCTENYSIV